MTNIVMTGSGKGGAGKTSTVTNLAGVLAGELDMRVLLVDLDPQGAASVALGVAADGPGTLELLAGDATVSEAAQETAVRNLYVVAAAPELGDAEAWLPEMDGWQTTLRNKLNRLSAYDIVLIDSAPGSAVLPVLGLYAADRVVVVALQDFFSLRATRQFLGEVAAASSSTGRPRVAGLVMTEPSRSTVHAREASAELERLVTPVLGVLQHRVVVQDAQVAGEPLTVYDPGSPLVAEYSRIACALAGV